MKVFMTVFGHPAKKILLAPGAIDFGVRLCYICGKRKRYDYEELERNLFGCLEMVCKETESGGCSETARGKGVEGLFSGKDEALLERPL